MTTQQQETTQERIPQFGDADFRPAAHADDTELAALEAELAKAEGGSAEAGEQNAEQGEAEHQDAQTDQGTQAKEQPPAEGEQQPQGRQPIMVPKGRLDQALHERDELRERLARLEGAVGALALGKQPAQPASEPANEPTPQERIDALKSDVEKLAERYEAGELSTKDWTTQNLALQEQILDIRMEMRSPSAPAQSDTYLQEQTDRLAEEFSVLQTMSAEDIEAIVPLARREAAKQGIDISTDLKLRRHIAATAQRLYGDNQPGAGGKPQAKDPRTQAANAKLEMARNAPPNLNPHAVAYQGPTGGTPTVEQAERMSDDELAALPPAVLAALERQASARKT